MYNRDREQHFRLRKEQRVRFADSRAERGRESDIYLVRASAPPHGVFLLYRKAFHTLV